MSRHILLLVITILHTCLCESDSHRNTYNGFPIKERSELELFFYTIPDHCESQAREIFPHYIPSQIYANSQERIHWNLSPGCENMMALFELQTAYEKLRYKTFYPMRRVDVTFDDQCNV